MSVRPPRAISHVSLRVRDSRRSAAFYCELLGFVEQAASPPREGVCICAGGSTAVVLIQGLPSGLPLAGVDHFAFAIESRDQVDALHERAVAMGARTTQPRIYDGFYQTFVFDPDGYKLELIAVENVQTNQGTDFVSDTQVVTGESFAGRTADAGRCGVLTTTG
jgi:predicted lactoylglutathione lyase